MKKRSKKKKLVVLVDKLKKIEGVNELGKYLSKQFHPGPLNLTVKNPLPWIGAFRISSSVIAFEMSKKCKGPLVSTSANISGESTPFKPEKIPFDLPVVYGHSLKKGPISTVYDPFKQKIIRKGAIQKNKIEQHVFAYNALQKIKPSRSENKQLLTKAEKVLKIVKKFHKNCLLGGSVAKGTFLRNSCDLDIFLLFPKKIKLENQLPLLEKIAMAIGKKAEISYAQHPYIKTKFEGIDVELVPAFKTKPPEILSAADRSRWHLKFVNKFSETKKDQIRIFKQFCKGIGVYGAETKTEGLSAYAMEVLVHKNENFIDTLNDILSTTWPIHQQDPIDNNRNILASVSKEKFELLKLASRLYLTNPNKKFFFPEKIKILKRTKCKKCVLIEIEKPDMIKDAMWGWAKRKSKKIKVQAEIFGYFCEKKEVFVDKKVWILMKFNKLRILKREMRGPLANHKNAKNFKQVHSNVFKKENRLYAIENNKFKTVQKLIETLETSLVFSGINFNKKYDVSSVSEKRAISKFLSVKLPFE